MSLPDTEISSMHSSPKSSSSPRLPAATAIDESLLPAGQCRYILVNPEIRGQRCGCVCFTLDRSVPPVICECGHSPCYHLKEAVQVVDTAALEHLTRRIQMLEEQLDRESKGGLGGALGDLVRRQVGLEEQIEKRVEEVTQERRDLYRQISRVWESIERTGSRQGSLENLLGEEDRRLARHEERMQRFEDRLLECDDAAMELEERVESLEGRGHQIQETSSLSTMSASEKPESSAGGDQRSDATETGLSETAVERWTVHVSLLPSASQAFPFEKDTTAYMRCLSRGLHQMVAVQGTDGEAFTTAVTAAFADMLQGRAWAPLQARLCDAASLQGLPMLRQLDASLAGHAWDVDFLRRHCAVCGPGGRLDSLYIAMTRDAFSWHFLRRLRPYLDGLEDSWAHDRLLDRGDGPEEAAPAGRQHPPAGEILPALPSSLKRAAPKTAEAEGSKAKVARKTCLPGPLEVRRRVETV